MLASLCTLCFYKLMSHNCAFCQIIKLITMHIHSILSVVFIFRIGQSCDEMAKPYHGNRFCMLAWSLRYGAFWAKLLIILLITAKIHLLLSVRSRRTLPNFPCATVTCRYTHQMLQLILIGDL